MLISRYFLIHSKKPIAYNPSRLIGLTASVSLHKIEEKPSLKRKHISIHVSRWEPYCEGGRKKNQ